MLTVSAARRRLPSPVGLPLAGFLRRAQRGLPCGVQDDPLEINAAAFRDGDQAALLIAIDTLIAGPDLTAAANALAQECFGPGALALVAASHTHFCSRHGSDAADAGRDGPGLCRSSACRAAAGRCRAPRGANWPERGTC